MNKNNIWLFTVIRVGYGPVVTNQLSRGYKASYVRISLYKYEHVVSFVIHARGNTRGSR